MLQSILNEHSDPILLVPFIISKIVRPAHLHRCQPIISSSEKNHHYRESSMMSIMVSIGITCTNILN